MSGLLQDLRYALRQAAKSPGFTALALTTLALGIGANTVIFVVINSVLVRPLPLPDADRIVRLQELHDRALNLTGATFHDVRERNKVFSGTAAYRIFSQNLSAASYAAAPEEIDTAFVSEDFLSVVKTQPLIGNGFSSGLFRDGAEGAVLLGYQLWQRHFGADASIVGKSILLHGKSCIVAGVMPPDFSFPEHVQAWEPIAEENSFSHNRRAHLFVTLARMMPAATPAIVRSDLLSIAAGIQRENSGVDPGFVLAEQPLKDNLVANVRPALLLLSGAVGFVLLIACANVANLLLSRSFSRRKETAIRAVLGASSFRLVRQFMVESLLLGTAGGAAGCCLGFWGAKFLAAAYSGAIPRMEAPGLDLPVIFFVVVASVVAALLFGVLPALKLSRLNLNRQLAEGGRSTGAAVRHPIQSSLVIAEVALAMVLLTGAGLLIRSFALLQGTDPGYDTSHLLVASVTLPESHYPALEQRQQFVGAVLERVQSLPGVRTAAAAGSLPLRPVADTDFELEGLTYKQGDEPSAEVLTSSPGYFEAMGIRLLAGRTFTPQDDAAHPRAVVISETMAKDYWPHESPLGKKMIMKDWGAPLPGQIVGVAADAKMDSLDTPPQPAVYYSLAQFPQGTLTTYFIVRTSSSLPALPAALRSAVWEVDKDQPVSVVTMDQIVSESLQRRRFLMTVLGTFAALALVLAVIGVYGVVAHSVGRRTYEFGMRLALGAQRHQVLLLVLKQGIFMVVTGLALGFVASFLLTRLLRNMLFEIGSTDPLTFSLIPALLIAVALIASYVPATRAARVDPSVALRYE